MCNNPYWLLRVHVDWLQQPSSMRPYFHLHRPTIHMGLSDFLNSCVLILNLTFFEDDYTILGFLDAPRSHCVSADNDCCNVCYWINFSFCVIIMPPIHGELSPAAWRCYSLVNLTLQGSVHVPIFCHTRLRNVSAIGAFFSSVECSFDFISKWM